MSNHPAVGISLGSTYSSVGVFRHGEFTIIPDEEENHRIPSCVAFAGAQCSVGERAKDSGTRNPSQAVHNITRLLGRAYDDPQLQAIRQFLPYKVVNYCGRPKISIERDGKIQTYYPEEIAAMLLGKLKEMAEMYLGERISNVVIAVPVGFDRFQRQATKEACELAGLNVKRMVGESTAAALAFGIHRAISTSTAKNTQNILVLDFGGGACSVSVVRFKNGFIEVLSTAGDSHLGGEDVNNLLVSHFVEKFRQKHLMDLRCSASAMQRLRTACEHAKRTLSSCAEATIELSSLMQGTDLRAKISRAQFEDLCYDLLRRAMALVGRALDDVHMRKEGIDEIVLVGGSTRIPKMQSLLTKYFGGKSLKSSYPNEATVYGAAVQAAILAGSKDPVLRTVLLMDALPFSLGIETADGTLAVALKRNRPLPTKNTITLYCTTKDHEQSAVTIKVYEGEDSLAKDNLLIRRFDHFGIAPAPRGVPRIAVTFDIGADGEMDVSAEDKTSDRDSVTSGSGAYSLAYLQ